MTTTTAGPKYREVEKALRHDIDGGLYLPGDRLPGEYDLARRFDVAYMTVRQAVANLVDEGVLIRVRGKGTFIVDSLPASTSQQRSCAPMTLLFPADWQQSDPYYFPELVDGFQQAMSADGHRAAIRGYEIVDSPNGIEPGSAIACLLIEAEHVRLIESLRDAGHKVLALNNYTGRRSIPCVRNDDAAGIEEAVDYLVGIGHEHIGFLRGKPGNIDAADRVRGFRRAVKKHELRDAVEAGDGFNEASGHAATAELLSAPNPPTALVCASDLAALGAIKAARDSGRFVPHDLSIVGFGDFSVAPYVTPSLTTVRQSRTELGKAAAQSLIQLAEDGATAGAILRPRLILRESAVPARSNVAPALVI